MKKHFWDEFWTKFTEQMFWTKFGPNLHLIFYTRHFNPKLWDPSICPILIKFGLHFNPHWIIFWTNIFGLLQNRTFTKNLKPCCLQYFSKYNNFRIIAQINWTIFDHFGRIFSTEKNFIWRFCHPNPDKINLTYFILHPTWQWYYTFE